MANNLGVASWLAPYANQYKSPLVGQSYYDSFKNAEAQRLKLREFAKDWVNDDDVLADGSLVDVDNMLEAQQRDSIIGGALTGLTGLGTVLSGASSAAQIQDTSAIEGQYRDLANYGNYNYNDYNQLANDYAQMPYAHSINAEAIRGMSDGQKVGSVASTTLSGAMTGLQVGGPIGALVGGVVGLGTGVGGVLAGDNRADNRAAYLNNLGQTSTEIAHANLGAAHERIGANIHRQNAVNAVKYGGAISRKQSIKEYADHVLGKGGPLQREHTPGGKIQRIKGEGGLTIRFKK